MATEDDRRGWALAELAREFMLWLAHNELPGVPGLKGTPFSHFEFYAGIYRKFEHGPQLPMWNEEPEELLRLQELKLGVSYVLLVNNLVDLVTLQDGRIFQRNRIVEAGKIPLDRSGALITTAPQLDSLKADEVTLSRHKYTDFGFLLRRPDLVYDVKAEAAQTSFKYKFIFDYDIPRRAYMDNVQDLPVPAELLVGLPGNKKNEVLAKREHDFREYIYHTATYRNRKRVVENGGDYYEKWRAKDSRNRKFQPTQLSDTYLKQCFLEPIMKRGDNLLLIDLMDRRILYRLIWKPPKRRAASPMVFTVQPLLTIVGLADPKPGKPNQKNDEESDDSLLRYPITAVFFHALEGADHLPNILRFGDLEYTSGVSKRFIVDYRAYVRYYYNNPNLNLGNDLEWLSRFVEVFFGDQSYPIELTLDPRNRVNREKLFLKALREEADRAVGPVKTRLAELVAWCDADPNRFFFTQGMRIGTEDRPREFIGISNGQVFEWFPNKEIVTRMNLIDWLEDIFLTDFTNKLYENLAPLVPYLVFMSWLGVAIVGGAALRVSVNLRELARTTIPQLVAHKAGKMISKEAARKAAPFVVAYLVEGIMTLFINSDNLVYQFLHGFFDGFGRGTVEHYLSEIDDRLEKQIEKIPRLAADIASKGGYTAYIVYDKMSNAMVKATDLITALSRVPNEMAKKIAIELGRFGEYIGTAFLIILFVVIYLDLVYRSGLSQDKAKIDNWVKKQKDALFFMVVETSEEVANYASELHEEIRSLRQSGKPITSEVVRKHEDSLARTVKDKLLKGANSVAAVADFLQLLLEEMGIDNWDELKRLGFLEVMSRGFEALPLKTLAPEYTHKLGSATGNLIGTIMLERKIVPKPIRKTSGIFGKRTSKFAKDALANGTWRALWRFAIFPFEDLSSIPAELKRGLEVAHNQKLKKFSTVHHRDTSYHDFLRDLIGDEEELARRLLRMAEDKELVGKISKLKTNVDGGIKPPSFEELIKGDNPDWPSDALIFVLYCWLRLGIRQILEAFNLIESEKLFDGKFRLSQLLDIIGLDIALDDQTVTALRAKFTKIKQ